MKALDKLLFRLRLLVLFGLLCLYLLIWLVLHLCVPPGVPRALLAVLAGPLTMLAILVPGAIWDLAGHGAAWIENRWL